MLNKKFIAFAWNVLILIFCLVNLSNINEIKTINIPHLDKVVHFIFYTTASFLWSWALLNSNSAKHKLNLTIINLGLIVFGLAVEFLQDVLPTQRSFEWLDVICNALGVFFGTAVYLIYIQFKPHNS